MSWHRCSEVSPGAGGSGLVCQILNGDTVDRKTTKKNGKVDTMK